MCLFTSSLTPVADSIAPTAFHCILQLVSFSDYCGFYFAVEAEAAVFSRDAELAPLQVRFWDGGDSGFDGTATAVDLYWDQAQKVAYVSF